MTLCEDPGCYDPGTGDYDVVVPADQPLGEYKLQVNCTDDETSHCSYLTFYVIEEGGDKPTLSPSLTPLETPSPVVPRTASPNTPTDAPVAPTASPNAPTTAPNAPTGSPNAPTTSPNAPTGSPNVPTGGPTAPTAGGPSAPTGTPTSPAVAPTPPDDPSLGEPGSPGTPPTPVPAKVECDATAELEFVYMQENTKLPLITVSHASGDREEVGCLTLTKLYDWLATAPEGVPEVNWHYSYRIIHTAGRLVRRVCFFIFLVGVFFYYSSSLFAVFYTGIYVHVIHTTGIYYIHTQCHSVPISYVGPFR